MHTGKKWNMPFTGNYFRHLNYELKEQCGCLSVTTQAFKIVLINLDKEITMIVPRNSYLIWWPEPGVGQCQENLPKGTSWWIFMKAKLLIENKNQHCFSNNSFSHVESCYDFWWVTCYNSYSKKWVKACKKASTERPL